MMLRPGKAQSARQSSALPKTFDSRSDQNAIFEIDRSNVVLRLRTLRRAIEEGAEEMEMVAIESVFGKSLSGALTRGGQELRLVARDLNRLLRLVERAHIPKAPVLSESMPKPRPRRKA